MICTECASPNLDDCLYCPTCGKPTPLSAERTLTELAAPIAAAQPEQEPQESASPAVAAVASPLLAPLDERTLRNRLTQANLCKVRGHWSEGVDHCVAVLQADPGSAAAHSLLGDIYAARGRREDAAQWYRMALEIRPHAGDEAKLRQVEGDALRMNRLPAGSGKRRQAPLAIDAQPPVGTVALMGVSPRLWLRGITAASVTFLVVSGAIMLGTQRRRGQDSAVPRPADYSGQVNSIAPAPGGVGTLPPSRPGGPSILPAGAPANTVQPAHQGGAGLEPDSSSASRTVPAAAPDTRQASSPATARPRTSVPTAPVRDIRPLEGRAEVPEFSTLTGGMKLAKMSSLTSRGEQVLVLANPPTAADQESFRQNAIRNVYRAARDAFATNAEAREASVYIQTDITEKGGQVLLTAHVDRESALRFNPDADRPDTLLNGLHGVEWAR